MTDRLIPAAQYLRMSTEHQQYSIDNQKEVVAGWAALNGYEIVSTYEDRGKSGLALRNRAALQQLLLDVAAGPGFAAILVYDVSRWGRFQNADEAAHYEFVCSEAGITVHYCAENFINDGNIPSSIMKALRRVMAGEYSRDLSRRVRAGTKRVVELGYSSGGAAPYGYRRMLVSADGHEKGLLHFRERKGLATDRVRYVLGPDHEVECVIPAIIEPEVFERVQEKLNDARKAVSSELLLEKLHAVLRENGRLSTKILNEAYRSGKVPSRTIYFQRFGSLYQTYRLVGFAGSKERIHGQQQRKNTIRLREALIDQIVELFPAHLHVLPAVKCNLRRIVLVDMRLRLTVLLCSRFKRAVTRRWLLNSVVIGRSEALLLCTLSDNNSAIENYYLLRGVSEKQLRMIPEGDRVLREALKLDSIVELYAGLCLRFRDELDN